MVSHLKPATPRRPRHVWLLWAAACALALSGCGGGGDGGGGEATAESTYFAVEGTQSAGGAPITVCIENLAYVDPASPQGQAIATKLVRYYGIVSGYRSLAGTGNNCRQRFASVDHLLSVADYNNLVLPAAAPAPSPSPSPSPSPAPSPSPSPSPSPNPSPSPAPISPLNCPSQSGNGTDGLSLYGVTTYNGLPGAAQTTGTLSFDPGEVGFSNPNLNASSITGSLRVQLWAVATPYAGGSISGYVVATYNLNFSYGSNQLRNGESSNLSTQSLSARTPPRGAYCLVVTLEQYDASCSAADRYCIADWYQYGTGAVFQ